MGSDEAERIEDNCDDKSTRYEKVGESLVLRVVSAY
jgi:hypothetical protein